MSLEGAAQLTKQLRQLGLLEDGKAIRTAVRAGMKPARELAKALIPQGVDAHQTYKGRLVAPGFAARNIKAIAYLSRDKQKAGAALGVRREAFYAVEFVEVGTSKQAAHPWLRPAFLSTRGQQLTAVTESLRKSIIKAASSR